MLGFSGKSLTFVLCIFLALDLCPYWVKPGFPKRQESCLVSTGRLARNWLAKRYIPPSLQGFEEVIIAVESRMPEVNRVFGFRGGSKASSLSSGVGLRAHVRRKCCRTPQRSVGQNQLRIGPAVLPDVLELVKFLLRRAIAISFIQTSANWKNGVSRCTFVPSPT